jgi:hypothetical protein
MASLLLGAAGAFVGSFFGPIGASIGWSIGSAVGAALDPQKTEGPRLSDLKLQGSQYGIMIPIIEGRSGRITGQVIWQTDLVEHAETSGGKGGPEVTNYTYTASWAVLLCEGPIENVTRIWADGRLIYDNDSYEQALQYDFTLYTGTEEQLPDPTIEADKGAGNVPAHRGYAYVVFTDVPLAEFGNRLPNLSFEVVKSLGEETGGGLVVSERVNGQAIEYDNGGYGNDGVPWITTWNSDHIVVQRMDTGGISHEYNGDDLTYIGTIEGDNYPFNAEFYGPNVITPFVYYSVGWYETSGFSPSRITLFVKPDLQTVPGLTNAPLAAGELRSDDDVNVTVYRNILDDISFPAFGTYIGGLSLSPDASKLLIFTAPTYGGNIDHWYLVIDTTIVDDGTVSPAQPFGHFGYSSWAADGNYNVNSLENNGNYMWLCQPQSAERISLWTFDSVTNNFSQDSGSPSLFPPIDLDDGAANSKVSIRVFRDGYIGIVMSDQLAIVSRLPTYADIGATLDSVVTSLSLRAGLTPLQLDVSTLVDDYVKGYVIGNQMSVRAALSQLQEAYFFDAVESEEVIKFVKRGADSILTISPDDLAAKEGVGNDLPALLGYTRGQEEDLPRRVYVNYVDIDTDYQPGSQHDERQVTSSETEQGIDIAIVMQATQAKQIASMALMMSWVERDRFTVYLPRKYNYIEPADVITVSPWVIRLRSKTEEPSGVVKFDAVATRSHIYLPSIVGAPGSGFEPGRPPQRQTTTALLLDIPYVSEAHANVGFYVALAGATSSAWAGATLFVSKDEGVTYESLATFTRPSTLGMTTTPLATFGGGNIFDEANTVTVTLGDGVDSTLESVSEELVRGGTNWAIIGNEIVGYKNATLVSAKTYVLSGLLRGRRGTEWAMSEHTTNDRFALLSTVYDVPVSGSEVGYARLYKMVTAGETVAGTAATPFTFRAVRLRPYSPAQIGGGSDGSGNVTINWVRRARVGANWLNFTDVPLGENQERYVVQIWEEGYDDCAFTVVVDNTSTYTYTAASQILHFGSTQRYLYVTVGQVGTYGLGIEGRATIAGLPSGTLNSNVITPITPYPSTFTPPPVTGNTVDENDWDNFVNLYYNVDVQLAHWYTKIAPVQSTGWFQRYQFRIIEDVFLGDTTAYNRWINDSEYNRPTLTIPEWNTLMALATAAGH